MLLGRFNLIFQIYSTLRSAMKSLAVKDHKPHQCTRLDFDIMNLN